jgi:pyrroline-5-carboxylate reductase
LKRIGFIGGGAMGEAFIRGLLTRGRDPNTIAVSEKNLERLDLLKKNYGIVSFRENRELVRFGEIIILAVKPQNLLEAVESFSSLITSDKLLVSILAGVTRAKIESLLPQGSKVIRAMPNTPALIGAGATVLAAGPGVAPGELQSVCEVFEAVGSVTVLPEDMLNAVTGLSGSGPAFAYLFIEALADGGVMAGLPRDTAYKLAAMTVKGAAMMVLDSKLHPAQLKDMVTSPGGTTIYGLLEMEKAGVRGAVMKTVVTAAKRAEEL